MYVDYDIIRTKVLNKLKTKWHSGENIIVTDKQYYVPTFNEFKTYIQYNKISISPTNPIQGGEGFDCDDYAFALKGHIGIFNKNVAKKNHSWAVGIILGHFAWINEYHAANWLLTRDHGLFLFEPQKYVDGFERFDKCIGSVKLVIL